MLTEQPSPDWSLAPPDATHAYQPPNWPMCWMKLGAANEVGQWRRVGSRSWRRDVSWCDKWLNHPHVTPRPSGPVNFSHG